MPTSLFEVEELIRMTQTHLDQAAGVEPNTIRGNRTPACKSAVFLCSEAKAEINAGMIIITNCRLQRPHAANEPAAQHGQRLIGQPSSIYTIFSSITKRRPVGQFRTPMDTYGHSHRNIACPLDPRIGAPRRVGHYSRHPLMEKLFGLDMARQTCKRSTALTTEDIYQLQQDTPAHNELRAPMNQFMERQFANQNPSKTIF